MDKSWETTPERIPSQRRARGPKNNHKMSMKFLQKSTRKPIFIFVEKEAQISMTLQPKTFLIWQISLLHLIFFHNFLEMNVFSHNLSHFNVFFVFF